MDWNNHGIIIIIIIIINGLISICNQNKWSALGAGCNCGSIAQPLLKQSAVLGHESVLVEIVALLLDGVDAAEGSQVCAFVVPLVVPCLRLVPTLVPGACGSSPLINQIKLVQAAFAAALSFALAAKPFTLAAKTFAFATKPFAALAAKAFAFATAVAFTAAAIAFAAASIAFAAAAIAAIAFAAAALEVRVGCRARSLDVPFAVAAMAGRVGERQRGRTVSGVVPVTSALVALAVVLALAFPFLPGGVKVLT